MSESTCAKLRKTDVHGVSLSNPPTPNAAWHFELPDRLKIAIADCVVAFARIETIALETVWVFEDSTLEEKRELTRDFVTKHFKKIKRVVKRMPGARTDKIWPTLEHLAGERNLIAHGFWAVNEEGRPVVLSHKFLKSEDYVIAEFFDYARFDYFLRRADHLLNTLRQFKTMLEAMPKESRIAAGLTLSKRQKNRWQRCMSLFRRFKVRFFHGSNVVRK
jgi:hypothetical protein